MPENRHWNRICRVFGFKDCRDAGAARAAAWLGVPREDLRATYDMRLRSASVHALDERLLAHCDAEVARLEKELADAKERRHQQWLAERNSDREAMSSCTASWTAPTTGERHVFHLLPHEEFIRDLLNEEIA